MNKAQDDGTQWSTVIPYTARADRGEIRRCWNPTVHPEMGLDGCQTLYEGFRRGAAISPLGPCMGFRAVSTSGFATPYIYSSYSECLARVNALAAGLHLLNLMPPNADDMKCLGLYMKNCMEWVLAEQACYTVGGVTVPFYDTLGPNTVSFILGQTDAATVVCTRAELEKLCHAKLTGECPALKAVVLIDGVTQAAADMVLKLFPVNTDDGKGDKAVLEIMSLAKVEAVGAQYLAENAKSTAPLDFHRPPNPKSVATFCYTSGTTGTPKGALITHENVMSAVAGMQATCGQALQFELWDRHLSYMPLPHIFERVVMIQLFTAGAAVAFYRGDPALLIEDFQACRPTFLIAAPRVLNKIYDKIHHGIWAAGGMKKKLFDAAVAAKLEGLRHGHLKHAFYDRLIFNKIKKGLGMDCLKALVSGSAPLAENVMSFFRILLGVPVLEGYGQTEGAAGCTLTHPDDVSTTGHVGGPVGSVEIVLMDVPEMGYFHTDRVHRDGQPCFGRGEICFRGPNVFAGYYKDLEKTKETIDDEGWLHSGDIGLWRTDGTLKIIDRKKNIFKLSQGEYVAPEKIENILTRSRLIAQCFVYGDSVQSCLVAIVVPDEEPLRVWAAASAPSLAKAPLEQLCQSVVVKNAVMDDIVRLSKEDGLHGFEMPKAILLIPHLFSVENDLLTPTFKLKRQKIRDQYEKEIEVLYASIADAVPMSKL